MRFLLVALLLAGLVFIPNPLRDLFTGSGTQPLPGLPGAEEPEAIRAVEQGKLKALLGDAAGEPVMVAFTSRYCHDCQRMAPYLEQAEATFPSVNLIELDVMNPDDRRWVEAFHPLVTPTLVAITPDVTVRQSWVGYQGLTQLEDAFQTIATEPSSDSGEPSA